LYLMQYWYSMGVVAANV